MPGRHLAIAQARSDAEFRAVGAFRYACYLADGLIDPSPEGCFLDEYDFLPNAQVYTVRSCDRIVGTIRLHLLNAQSHDSATMTAFSDILMPKVDAGLTLIDGARFAVAPDIGAMRLAAARQTLRLYAQIATRHAVDYGVAAVLDDRVTFYRRLFGFERISDPRDYGQLKKPLVLMGVDLRRSRLRDRHTGGGTHTPVSGAPVG